MIIAATDKMLGSYRTYEEWKLLFPIVVMSSLLWVLTVPMRNGNKKYNKFYLETSKRSYRTYEEWKRNAKEL